MTDDFKLTDDSVDDCVSTLTGNNCFYRPETFDFATSVYADNSHDYTLCLHMMYILDYFTDIRLVTFRPPA